MSSPLVLAVDQGTTNTKALLIDASGTVHARASRRVPIAFPQSAWVEQDAVTIWSSVLEVTCDVLAAVPGARVAAIGISNQRETVVVWDRATGQPVGPAIVWQCRRTAPFCRSLREAGHESLITERTGLAIDPLFSATKVRWLLDSLPNGRPRAERGELCAGTIDSWLLWNLSGGRVHACDLTNASRTQILNLATRRWDADLLAVFGVPAAILPDVHPSSAHYGTTVGNDGIPPDIPITAMIGDSHAALFAHGAFRNGGVKATYGTGSSLMTPVASPMRSSAGLSSTVAWALPDAVTYALEGNITVTGSAIDWLGQFLGFADPAKQVAELAASVSDTGGVYLVPAFAGLGAPHWDDGARALLFGMTRGTTAAHACRAAVESIAFQVRDVFAAMERDTGSVIPELLADGGATRNDQLMQFQADILGRPVVRNRSTDLSARGAAYLAGLQAGLWPSLDDIVSLPQETERFEPRMNEDTRRRAIAGWHDAVDRSRSRAMGRAAE